MRIYETKWIRSVVFKETRFKVLYIPVIQSDGVETLLYSCAALTDNEVFSQNVRGVIKVLNKNSTDSLKEFFEVKGLRKRDLKERDVAQLNAILTSIGEPPIKGRKFLTYSQEQV